MSENVANWNGRRATLNLLILGTSAGKTLAVHIQISGGTQEFGRLTLLNYTTTLLQLCRPAYYIKLELKVYQSKHARSQTDYTHSMPSFRPTVI